MRRKRRKSVSREILAIRKALSAIARSVQRLAPTLEAAAAAGSAKPSRRGRKLKLSPARRAALKLQGQYMGYLRNLKPGQKLRAKELRETKGVRAAIRLAKQLGKR